MDAETKAAIERLEACEYPGNAPHELDKYEAETRMRDLWAAYRGLLAENESLRPRPERGAGWVSDGDTILSGESVLARFVSASALMKLASAECERLLAANEKLARFKAYVHARLDAAGVTVDPESAHKEAGCRIGGRLDELIGQRDALEAERDRLREALTWACGFIRCNFPSAREQYEDMRNAESLAEAHPLWTGEFQRASARAELAEVECARLRAAIAKHHGQRADDREQESS